MNIHNKLSVGVPFASIKQGDLFCAGHSRELYIKLRGNYPLVTQYPFNSYKVGEKKGGRNFYESDMVMPVNDVTVS